MSDIFHNLTDFFSQPNFPSFESVRKPSSIDNLFDMPIEGFSLELDIVDICPAQTFHIATPSNTSNAGPALQLTEVDFDHEHMDEASMSNFNLPQSAFSMNNTPRSSEQRAPAFTQKKKFYNKNSCRNIIRKAVRYIQSKACVEELKTICAMENQSYTEFYDHVTRSFEDFTGPAALKKFLEPRDSIANVFRRFLIWFLEQRYVREALKEGHMKDIQKYIEYKNMELLPMLTRLG